MNKFKALSEAMQLLYQVDSHHIARVDYYRSSKKYTTEFFSDNTVTLAALIQLTTIEPEIKTYRNGQADAFYTVKFNFPYEAEATETVEASGLTSEKLHKCLNHDCTTLISKAYSYCDRHDADNADGSLKSMATDADENKAIIEDAKKLEKELLPNQCPDCRMGLGRHARLCANRTFSE